MIAGAAYEWPAPVDLKWRMPTWPVVGELLVNTLPLVVARFTLEGSVRDAFAPEPVAPNYSYGAVRLALRPSSYRATAEDVRLLKPFLRQQSARYRTLKIPLVILTGDSDRVVSPQIHSEQLHAAVPHSELIVFPGAGHLLPYSRPDAVLRAIARAMELAAGD